MSKNSIFPRRIKKMQEEVLRTDINDITFMNINKRGGFSKRVFLIEMILKKELNLFFYSFF